MSTHFPHDTLKGPHGETWYNLNILPTDYCILRAASETEGLKWMKAIQDSLTHEQSLLHRGRSNSETTKDSTSLSDGNPGPNGAPAGSADGDNNVFPGIDPES